MAREVNLSLPVRTRMMAFAFLDELGPLVTLHTLWFADHGVTAAQISTAFLLWAGIGLVLEVPSGALADRMDRRHLIGHALALRAAGFVVWLLWPSWAGLAIGASLWAAHSALASGAWEALIYDQLAATGEQLDYQRTHARIEQAHTAGIFGSTALAFALLATGTELSWLGWLTVALHGPSWWAIRSLPAVPLTPDDRDDGSALSFAAWWNTLKAGVRQVTGRRTVGRVVAVTGSLGGLLLMDEYVPLIGRVRGATGAEIAVLVCFVWLGGLAGSELAARSSWSAAAAAATLLAGTSVALAALFAGPWWTLPLLSVGYGAQFFAWIHADARLQENLEDSTRATATSVRELLSNGVSMAMLALVGWLSVGEDPTRGVAAMLMGIVLVAVCLAWWVPPARRSRRVRHAPRP